MQTLLSSFHIHQSLEEGLQKYSYPMIEKERLWGQYLQKAFEISSDDVNSQSVMNDFFLYGVMKELALKWLVDASSDQLLQKKESFENKCFSALFPEEIDVQSTTQAHLFHLKTELADFFEYSRYEFFCLTEEGAFPHDQFINKVVRLFLELICQRYLSVLQSLQSQVVPEHSDLLKNILMNLENLLEKIRDDSTSDHFKTLAEFPSTSLVIIDPSDHTKKTIHLFSGKRNESIERDFSDCSQFSVYPHLIEDLEQKSRSYLKAQIFQRAFLEHEKSLIKSLGTKMTEMICNMIPLWYRQEKLTISMMRQKYSQEIINDEMVFENSMFEVALQCLLSEKYVRLMNMMEELQEKYGSAILVREDRSFKALDILLQGAFKELRCTQRAYCLTKGDLESWQSMILKIDLLEKSYVRSHVLYQLSVITAVRNLLEKIKKIPELMACADLWKHSFLLKLKVDVSDHDLIPDEVAHDLEALKKDMKKGFIESQMLLTNQEDQKEIKKILQSENISTICEVLRVCQSISNGALLKRTIPQLIEELRQEEELFEDFDDLVHGPVFLPITQKCQMIDQILDDPEYPWTAKAVEKLKQKYLCANSLLSKRKHDRGGELLHQSSSPLLLSIPDESHVSSRKKSKQSV